VAVARRSTRNKVRYQANKAIGAMERALEHFQALDELCGGQSQPVNTILPQLTAMQVKIRDLTLEFRSKL